MPAKFCSGPVVYSHMRTRRFNLMVATFAPIVPVLVLVGCYFALHLAIGIEHPRMTSLTSSLSVTMATPSHAAAELNGRVVWIVVWLAYTVGLLLLTFDVASSFWQMLSSLKPQHARIWKRLTFPITIGALMLTVAGVVNLFFVKSLDRSGDILYVMEPRWLTLNIASFAPFFTVVASALLALWLSLQLFILHLHARTTIDDLTATATRIGWRLQASALMLVLGTISTFAMAQWGASYYTGEDHKVVSSIANSLSAAAGLFYSIFLAVLFGPTWICLMALVKRRSTTAPLQSSQVTQLQQAGLSAGFKDNFKALVALLAPFIAGLLGGPIAELLKRVNV
jgi:hypothetical protein